MNLSLPTIHHAQRQQQLFLLGDPRTYGRCPVALVDAATFARVTPAAADATTSTPEPHRPHAPPVTPPGRPCRRHGLTAKGATDDE